MGCEPQLSLKCEQERKCALIFMVTLRSMSTEDDAPPQLAESSSNLRERSHTDLGGDEARVR